MTRETVAVAGPVLGVVVGMAVMVLGVLRPGQINPTLLAGTVILLGGIGWLSRDIIALEAAGDIEH
jgi:hypothetical protein